MPKYYVDIPAVEKGWGFSHCHDVVDADSPEQAARTHRQEFDTLPNTATLLPDDMHDWPKEKILSHYGYLHDKLGDKRFYEEVMKAPNPFLPPEAEKTLEKALRVYPIGTLIVDKHTFSYEKDEWGRDTYIPARVGDIHGVVIGISPYAQRDGSKYSVEAKFIELGKNTTVGIPNKSKDLRKAYFWERKNKSYYPDDLEERLGLDCKILKEEFSRMIKVPNKVKKSPILDRIIEYFF
ncbi:hypothetical protein HZC32_01715 [Candidatus Woesearchaeota archaeon]|nr:hypothetical protein [Candidatus Woesearchaeota archaeon]